MKTEPHYQRVRADLEARIRRGEYAKGEYIPPEGKLCAIYGVSRTTVRTAVGALVDCGLLTIDRGKGTRVAVSRIEGSQPNLMSVTEILAQNGRRHDIIAMELSECRPSAEVADKLGISPEEPVLRFWRVRSMDDEPMTEHVSYLPLNYLGPIDGGLLRQKKSLYKVLREDCGVVIESALDRISAEGASAETARLLRVHKGDPVLHLERVAYDKSGRIVEYSNIFYRADRYVHTVVTARGSRNQEG